MLIENEGSENKSTIQISEDLGNALKDLGQKGESYQDIIWRLATKKRRSGNTYNKKELMEKFEDMDEVFVLFDDNLQDLDGAIGTHEEEIDTEEIRSIMVAIEQLCDELDDLSLENEPN